MLKQNKFLTAILIKFFIVNFTEIAHKSNAGFIEYWRQTTYLQNVLVGLQWQRECVCVCVRERERMREREKEHEKEREWEREKDWTWILH